jgi:hypothetical protein
MILASDKILYVHYFTVSTTRLHMRRAAHTCSSANSNACSTIYNQLTD